MGFQTEEDRDSLLPWPGLQAINGITSNSPFPKVSHKGFLWTGNFPQVSASTWTHSWGKSDGRDGTTYETRAASARGWSLAAPYDVRRPCREQLPQECHHSPCRWRLVITSRFMMLLAAVITHPFHRKPSAVHRCALALNFAMDQPSIVHADERW